MRKAFIISFYTIYLFLFFGLIFHTSAHPQIFSKYTYKYLSMLVFLVLFFPVFLWGIIFITKTTVFKYKKGKKIIITPLKKVLIIFVVLILFIITPAEVFLRDKYKDYESTAYTYTKDNFNPFLQSQIAKHENLTVNSLGFRGEEIDSVKKENTYRIAILGGSTVLNREVPFEKNTARLLEKKLRSKYSDKKIEVINAGKDYYTSEHSLIQYMFKVADLKPDLVIMWHGANDIMASCLLEGNISYGKYQSDYSHLFGAVTHVMFNYFRPQPVIQIKLVSADFLLKALQDNLYTDFTNKLKQKKKENIARDYMENKNTVTVHDFPSLAAYKRNLEYFIKFAAQQGTPIILGNQPSLIKEKNTLAEVEAIMYPRIACEKDGKYYNLASLKYANDLFNAETEKIAEKSDVLFIDLDKSIPKNLANFLDGPHYTESGNEKAAQALFDLITSQNLVTKDE